MTHYKLQYVIEHAIDKRYPMSPPSRGTCLGIIFDSEEKVNSYLDLLVKDGSTILETNIIELKDYKPRKSYVYATTRSWER